MTLGTIVGLIAAALFFAFRALSELIRAGIRSGAINLLGAFLLFGSAAALAWTALPDANAFEDTNSSFVRGCTRACSAQGNLEVACLPYCECMEDILSEGKSREEFKSLVARASRDDAPEAQREVDSAAETCATQSEASPDEG